MYTLKQKPEDFIVKEISTVKFTTSGRYAYVLVKKENRNTLDVVKQISRQLGVPEKKVGFAGTKDKHAITEQMMSIYSVGKDKVEKLNIENVSVELKGFGDIPISLGDLDGNKFEIVVRDYSEKVEETDFVVNYFDEQRFGGKNEKIGKAIIKKDFKKACELLRLLVVRNDYIGSLNKISLRMLRFYVHAYQSYLWNETVSEYLMKFDVVKEVEYKLGKLVFVKEKVDAKIPLIGFDSSLVVGEFSEIIKEIMKKEEITHRDFIIKQIPDLSVEGELRDVCVDVKDLVIERLDESSVRLSFVLGKSSYATMVVKRILV
jgi:tRNA pseudouridine13 synthase